MILAALMLFEAVAATPPAVIAALNPADRSAAMAAAGFRLEDGRWRSDCDDPGTPSYTPGTIETLGDLNGDGRPEALVVEGGTYCFGNSGQGYSLVSKQADGGWRLITSGIGFPEFLATTGRDGWPDLSVGGPGFCFPVLRWNGSEYRLNRQEYQGRPCTRSR